MYIKERNASTFALKDSKNNSDTYTLTHNIADSICNYDYPLSVRVSTPSASGSVKVTQNGKAVEAGVFDGMVYFSAIPNGGDIVVTSETPACQHNLNVVEKKNATCEVDGTNAYYVCKLCGTNFADSTGKTPIEDINVWKNGDGKIAKKRAFLYS